MDTAARAMISRAMGAGNNDLAKHLAVQSIILSSIMSLSWIVLAVIFAKQLRAILGVSEAV